MTLEKTPKRPNKRTLLLGFLIGLVVGGVAALMRSSEPTSGASSQPFWKLDPLRDSLEAGRAAAHRRRNSLNR